MENKSVTPLAPEEIAEKLAEEIWDFPSYSGKTQELIAEALQAYGLQQRREGLNPDLLEMLRSKYRNEALNDFKVKEWHYNKGRMKGVEEAAKMIETYTTINNGKLIDSDFLVGLASIVRSALIPPQGKP